MSYQRPDLEKHAGNSSDTRTGEKYNFRYRGEDQTKLVSQDKDPLLPPTPTKTLEDGVVTVSRAHYQMLREVRFQGKNYPQQKIREILSENFMSTCNTVIQYRIVKQHEVIEDGPDVSITRFNYIDRAIRESWVLRCSAPYNKGIPYEHGGVAPYFVTELLSFLSDDERLTMLCRAAHAEGWQESANWKEYWNSHNEKRRGSFLIMASKFLAFLRHTAIDDHSRERHIYKDPYLADSHGWVHIDMLWKEWLARERSPLTLTAFQFLVLTMFNPGARYQLMVVDMVGPTEEGRCGLAYDQLIQPRMDGINCGWPTLYVHNNNFQIYIRVPHGTTDPMRTSQMISTITLTHEDYHHEANGYKVPRLADICEERFGTRDLDQVHFVHACDHPACMSIFTEGIKPGHLLPRSSSRSNRTDIHFGVLIPEVRMGQEDTHVKTHKIYWIFLRIDSHLATPGNDISLTASNIWVTSKIIKPSCLIFVDTANMCYLNWTMTRNPLSNAFQRLLREEDEYRRDKNAYRQRAILLQNARFKALRIKNETPVQPRPKATPHVSANSASSSSTGPIPPAVVSSSNADRDDDQMDVDLNETEEETEGHDGTVMAWQAPNLKDNVRIRTHKPMPTDTGSDVPLTFLEQHEKFYHPPNDLTKSPLFWSCALPTIHFILDVNAVSALTPEKWARRMSNDLVYSCETLLTFIPEETPVAFAYFMKKIIEELMTFRSKTAMVHPRYDEALNWQVVGFIMNWYEMTFKRMTLELPCLPVNDIPNWGKICNFFKLLKRIVMKKCDKACLTAYLITHQEGSQFVNFINEFNMENPLVADPDKQVMMRILAPSQAAPPSLPSSQSHVRSREEITSSDPESQARSPSTESAPLAVRQRTVQVSEPEETMADVTARADNGSADYGSESEENAMDVGEPTNNVEASTPWYDDPEKRRQLHARLLIRERYDPAPSPWLTRQTSPVDETGTESSQGRNQVTVQGLFHTDITDVVSTGLQYLTSNHEVDEDQYIRQSARNQMALRYRPQVNDDDKASLSRALKVMNQNGLPYMRLQSWDTILTHVQEMENIGPKERELAGLIQREKDKILSRLAVNVLNIQEKLEPKTVTSQAPIRKERTCISTELDYLYFMALQLAIETMEQENWMTYTDDAARYNQLMRQCWIIEFNEERCFQQFKELSNLTRVRSEWASLGSTELFWKCEDLLGRPIPTTKEQKEHLNREARDYEDEGVETTFSMYIYNRRRLERCHQRFRTPMHLFKDQESKDRYIMLAYKDFVWNRQFPQYWMAYRFVCKRATPNHFQFNDEEYFTNIFRDGNMASHLSSIPTDPHEELFSSETTTSSMLQIGRITDGIQEKIAPAFIRLYNSDWNCLPTIFVSCFTMYYAMNMGTLTDEMEHDMMTTAHKWNEELLPCLHSQVEEVTDLIETTAKHLRNNTIALNFKLGEYCPRVRALMNTVEIKESSFYWNQRTKAVYTSLMMIPITATQLLGRLQLVLKEKYQYWLNSARAPWNTNAEEPLHMRHLYRAPKREVIPQMWAGLHSGRTASHNFNYDHVARQVRRQKIEADQRYDPERLTMYEVLAEEPHEIDDLYSTKSYEDNDAWAGSFIPDPFLENGTKCVFTQELRNQVKEMKNVPWAAIARTTLHSMRIHMTDHRPFSFDLIKDEEVDEIIKLWNNTGKTKLSDLDETNTIRTMGHLRAAIRMWAKTSPKAAYIITHCKKPWRKHLNGCTSQKDLYSWLSDVIGTVYGIDHCGMNPKVKFSCLPNDFFQWFLTQCIFKDIEMHLQEDGSALAAERAGDIMEMCIGTWIVEKCPAILDGFMNLYHTGLRGLDPRCWPQVVPRLFTPINIEVWPHNVLGINVPPPPPRVHVNLPNVARRLYMNTLIDFREVTDTRYNERDVLSTKEIPYVEQMIQRHLGERTDQENVNPSDVFNPIIRDGHTYQMQQLKALHEVCQNDAGTRRIMAPPTVSEFLKSLLEEMNYYEELGAAWQPLLEIMKLETEFKEILFIHRRANEMVRRDHYQSLVRSVEKYSRTIKVSDLLGVLASRFKFDQQKRLDLNTQFQTSTFSCDHITTKQDVKKLTSVLKDHSGHIVILRNCDFLQDLPDAATKFLQDLQQNMGKNTRAHHVTGNHMILVKSEDYYQQIEIEEHFVNELLTRCEHDFRLPTVVWTIKLPFYVTTYRRQGYHTQTEGRAMLDAKGCVEDYYSDEHRTIQQVRWNGLSEIVVALTTCDIKKDIRRVQGVSQKSENKINDELIKVQMAKAYYFCISNVLEATPTIWLLDTPTLALHTAAGDRTTEMNDSILATQLQKAVEEFNSTTHFALRIGNTEPQGPPITDDVTDTALREKPYYFVVLHACQSPFNLMTRASTVFQVLSHKKRRGSSNQRMNQNRMERLYLCTPFSSSYTLNQDACGHAVEALSRDPMFTPNIFDTDDQHNVSIHGRYLPMDWQCRIPSNSKGGSMVPLHMMKIEDLIGGDTDLHTMAIPHFRRPFSLFLTNLGSKAAKSKAHTESLHHQPRLYDRPTNPVHPQRSLPWQRRGQPGSNYQYNEEEEDESPEFCDNDGHTLSDTTSTYSRGSRYAPYDRNQGQGSSSSSHWHQAPYNEWRESHWRNWEDQDDRDFEGRALEWQSYRERY